MQILKCKRWFYKIIFQKSNQTKGLDCLSKELLEKERIYFENIHQNFLNTQNYIIRYKKQNLHQIFKNNSDEVSAYGTSIGATVFKYQLVLTDKIKTFFYDDPLRQNTFSPALEHCKKGRSPEMNAFKIVYSLHRFIFIK